MRPASTGNAEALDRQATAAVRSCSRRACHGGIDKYQVRMGIVINRDICEPVWMARNEVSCVVL